MICREQSPPCAGLVVVLVGRNPDDESLRPAERRSAIELPCRCMSTLEITLWPAEIEKLISIKKINPHRVLPNYIRAEFDVYFAAIGLKIPFGRLR